MSGLDFDQSSDRLAAASVDGVIRVWALRRRLIGRPEQSVQELGGRTAPARSVQFSADGKWLVGAYDDRVARVWSSVPGRPPRLLEGHAAPLTAAAFGPASDDNTLAVATVSIDQTARLWTLRLNRARRIAPFRVADGPAADMPATLARSRSVTTAANWRLAPRTARRASGRRRRRSRGYSAGTMTRFSRPTSILLEPTSSRRPGTALPGCGQSTILPDREAAENPDRLALRQAGVRAAAFNPQNENQVATGSQDGRLGLWDVVTGQSTFYPVDPVPGAAPLLAVALQPGRYPHCGFVARPRSQDMDAHRLRRSRLERCWRIRRPPATVTTGCSMSSSTPKTTPGSLRQPPTDGPGCGPEVSRPSNALRLQCPRARRRRRHPKTIGS